MASTTETGLAKAKGFTDNVREFITDTRTEMRKVTAPSPKEVRATTTVVIVTVFIFAAYFFVVDKSIGFVVDKILHYFQG
jgi:preprotein translocase subunit SecE